MQNSLTEADISEIIEMALSDHTAFSHIRQLAGLEDKQVKALMRKHLRPGKLSGMAKAGA